jgi:hypothetical protein
MALFLLSANLGWIQGQFNFTEDSLRYPEKPIGGNVREELRMEVESPFHEPETVEHHGLDKLTVREVVARLGDRTVNDRGDIESIEGTGNNSEVADRDVGSFNEGSRGGYKMR